MSENEKDEILHGLDSSIQEIIAQRECEKEEKFVNLVIDIIVSATLREYYEKSDKISKIQSNRTE